MRQRSTTRRTTAWPVAVLATLVLLALTPAQSATGMWPRKPTGTPGVLGTTGATRVATAELAPVSAAEKFGWGKPVARDEFGYTGAPKRKKWSVYDSPGHAGNGVRSPRAWRVNGRVATVTGNAHGRTGGMSAKFGHRRYGRWEVRMRTNARDPEYHPVLLLWPDSGDWPCDGEIDYAEGTSDVTKMNFFHHYSCSNEQTHATRSVDTTKWHNYAVEWTPDGIVGYLDGKEWFRDTDPAHQPPGSMHQTVQLDWFPDGTDTTRSRMKVDWVRVYDVGSPRLGAQAAAGGIRLAVLGDVNHDGNSSRSSREGKIAASIDAWTPRAVALVGDFQYDYGDCSSLVGEFDRTGWGALLPKVVGAAGPTHDYTSDDPSSASDYSRHMEGTCPGQSSGQSLSARQWDKTIQPYKPHYVDLGAWTLISMPSGQWRGDYADTYGAAWSGATLTDWLRSAVKRAKARGDHVAVMEHEPYWTSGTDDHSEDEGDAQRPWIKVLDRFDVRLLFAGHQHNYERFRPQELDGTVNRSTGTQEFQVSTGGIGLREFTTTARNSVVRSSDTYGWLRVVLKPDGSYTWGFVPVEGDFTDSGRRAAP
jgi:glycosyl hydrolase family 16